MAIETKFIGDMVYYGIAQCKGDPLERRFHDVMTGFHKYSDCDAGLQAFCRKFGEIFLSEVIGYVDCFPEG